MPLSGLLLSWVTPLVRQGAAAPLNYADLLPTPHDTTPRASSSALWQHWTKTCMSGRPSLLRAISGAFGGPYYRLALLKLLNDSVTFAGAMLLNLLVTHLEDAQAAATAGSSGSNGGSNGGSTGGSSGGCGSSSVLGVVLLPGWCGRGSPCWGYLLAALLGGSVAAKALIGAHYNYGLNLVTIRLRSGLMGMLFRTSLMTRTTDASGGGTTAAGGGGGGGAAAAGSTAAAAGADLNTLMAVDAGRAANLALSLQELWSLPLQILAAMTLLYMQVRTAFIAGVLLCVALIPINRLIATRIQAASVSMMSAKDTRVGLMGELLRHLAIVKALGWEEVLGDKVLSHRHDELRALAVRKYLDALCVYFWAATQLLLSGTTFGLMVLLGQPLRPSAVFTSLALFNVLIAPLNAFPWVVNGVVEALVSVNRIQAYLLLPQRCPGWAYPQALLPSILAAQQQQRLAAAAAAAAAAGGSSSGNRGGCCGRGRAKGTAGRKDPQQQQQQWMCVQQMGQCVWVSAEAGVGGGGDGCPPQHELDSFAAVQFCNASFAWRRGSPPCLSELRLSIPAGCLTAVVGEVGSGKSSLLSAILGELDLVAGHALLPVHGMCHPQQQQQQQQQQAQHQQQQQARVRRVGYVGQSPWLMRGSVRDNVLLGQEHDAELLGEIYHAVGLDTDLAAMPAGDLTPVGEGGSGLSGGQRLRVGLARALYQPGTRLFLLDDLLASLDSHVAQWVIRHTLFGGLLSGATLVVVTKHPAVIQAAQLVVAMQLGRVAFSGSPAAYADWRAQHSHYQQQQQQAKGDGSNGWRPLVRHTTSNQQQHPQLNAPQQQQQQQQQDAAAAAGAAAVNGVSESPPGLSIHAPHPALADMLAPTSPSSSTGDPLTPSAAAAGAATAGSCSGIAAAAAAAAAAAVEISLDSEDVPVSELLLAGGHGVWAPHASLAPQLNAISEEEGVLDSAGSSGVLLDGCGSSGSSSDGSNGSNDSWEVVESPNGHRERKPTQEQQQQQQPEASNTTSPGPIAIAAVAAAAAVAASAAAVDSAGQELPTAPTRPAGRLVSFSSDVITADDDKQQQQQQQQQVYPQPQHQQQQQQAAEGVEDSSGSSSGGVCGVGDEEEGRAVGAVGWGVYGSYFRAVGVMMCCAVLGSLLAMQASKNGVDLWVTSSLSHNTSVTIGQYSNSSSSSSSWVWAYELNDSSSSSSSRAAAAVTPSGSVHMFLSSSVAAGLAAAGGHAAATAAGSTAAAPATAAGFQAWSFAAAAAAAAADSSMGSVCRALNSSNNSSSDTSVHSVQHLRFGAAPPSHHHQQQPHAGVAHSSSYPRPARKLLLLPGPHPPSSFPAVWQSNWQSNWRLHWRLQGWQEHPSKPPLDPSMVRFLKGLAIISGINTLATLARAFTFAAAGMAAARGVHTRLLGAVLGAPLAALDSMPAGRLLNRFSSDTSVVDDSLPFILNILLANAVSLAGLLGVLLASQPLLGLVLLPLGLMYRRLQLFYRSSALELRRLEAVGLSPLYGLCSDTAAGADTVRAAAAQGLFMQRFLREMVPYQSACVNNAAASNWLSMRLQLLAAVLLSAVAALAAVVAATALDDTAAAAAAADDSRLWGVAAFPGPLLFDGSSSSSGSGWGDGSNGSSGSSSSWIGGTFRVDLLGLALAYCLPIVNLLNGLLTSSAETEQDMVAVERIAALLDSLPSPQQQQQRRRRRLAAGSLQEPLLLEQRQHEQQQQQQQQQQRADQGEGAGRGRALVWETAAAAAGAGAAAAGAAGAQAYPPALEMLNVVMRYRPGLPPALRGVSLTVPVGHKLGVCGRTGAGKSSLLSVLLRLRPIESGSVHLLGTDAAALSSRELRRRFFAVVPQQPVLFGGSLRENLDPYGRATDEQLAATLQAVHMWAPLCRIALHKQLLGHSTYLMARRAGGLVGPGYQRHTPPAPAAAAAAAAAAAGAAAGAAGGGGNANPAIPIGRGLQRSSVQQQAGQVQPQAGHPAAAAAAAAVAEPADEEVAAIAAAWSTRRRALPLDNPPGLFGRDRSGSAGGGVSLSSQLLEEGGALAVGAAAGATDAIQQQQQSARRRSLSASATGNSLNKVLQAAAAAVVGSPVTKPLADLLLSVRRVSSEGGPGQQQQQRRRSSRGGEEAVVLPPVPMHPADKVLSMQVGGPGGLSLSSGQAQLVCVARCLLAGAPLVLLDEATAAVDPRTAGLLRQVLHEQFDTLTCHNLGRSNNTGTSSNTDSSSRTQPRQHHHHQTFRQRQQQRQQEDEEDSEQQQRQQQWWWQQVPIRPTVIQIAHELSAIMDYDTVAVMAGGQVVEVGPPQVLAAQEGSRFNRLRAQEGH